MKSNMSMKPWLNENGKIYPDSILKVISKNWDQKTWDRFLTATVDVPQKETELGDGAKIDNLSQKDHDEAFTSSICREDISKTKDLIDKIINNLPQKEASVIKLLFHKNMSTSQVAVKFGVSGPWVRKIRGRGIKLLKNKLEQIKLQINSN